MTLSEFLTAAKNEDMLFTIINGTDSAHPVIAKLTAKSVDALSATVAAYTVTAFTVNTKTDAAVTVTTA